MTEASPTTCHLRIVAPRFVAAVRLRRHSYSGTWTVAETAPIVAYMHGWVYRKVREHAAKRGWDVETLREATHA